MNFRLIWLFCLLLGSFCFLACGDSSSDSSSDSDVLSYNEIQALNNANGSNSNSGTGSNFFTNPNYNETPDPETNPDDNSNNGTGESEFSSRTLNFIDGADGNLWKPVSENNGNVVVLFNSSFQSVFSGGCSMELKSGGTTQLYCGGVLSCFTNPNRLTLRSNVRCEDVKEVRVTCNGVNEVVVFTVPAELRSQVCSRHD